MTIDLTTERAIERYVEIRHRLPTAAHPETTRFVANLSDLIDEFDLFVLDGFGVLNVGASPIDGAADRIHQLREAGATVVVLTNGATVPTSVSKKKYANWDMAFDTDAIVSSRDALMHGLQGPDYVNRHWGVAGTDFAEIDSLGVSCHLLDDSATSFDTAEGFIFLSALDWTDARQGRLLSALKENPRPVLVGNPDLVAPHPTGLSLEPGWYTNAIADEIGIEPVFFGKPFGNAFDAVLRRFPGFERQRIAMVGDSPHTDILGGASAGWRTVLVHDHGLCKGHDLEAVFKQTGIRSDFVVRTT